MIQLFTLGTTDLRTRDGADLHSFLAGPKRFAALSYLVLARPRGFHRRDVLLSHFWPEADKTRARGALRGMVHRIRRDLGDPVLVNRGREEVGVPPSAIWCDVVAFEEALDAGRLRPAMELYRGHLFEGFFAPGVAPAFEHWMDGERERLRLRAVSAAWRLAGLENEEEGAGDISDAALYWGRRAVSLAPLGEKGVRRLMRLQARSGDRAGALETYEALAQGLENRFGIEPSESTRGLADDIRRGTHLAPRQPAPEGDPLPGSAAKEPSTAARQSPARKGVSPALATSFEGGQPDPARAVAVLPFAFLGRDGPDATLAYLGKGMAGELIDRLTRTRGLRVAARTSSFAAAEAGGDVSTIAGKLGVDHLIEGSVQVSGERMRLQAHLVDATSGYELWSKTFDRRLDDILSAQDEVGRHLNDAVRTEILGQAASTTEEQGPPLPAPRPPHSADAHRLYLKGRYLWNRRSETSLRNAVSYLEEATRTDPDYARAHAGLADCYLALSSPTVGAISSREGLARARTCAERAVVLDDGLAEAHVSLGVQRMQQGDWSEAEARFRRALALDPHLAAAHQRYSWLLVFTGELDRALERMQMAERLDPLCLPIATGIGRIHHFARRPAEAIEQYRRVLELDASYHPARMTLALALVLEGRAEEALEDSHRAASAANGSKALHMAFLAYVAAMAGQRSRARHLLTGLLTEGDDAQRFPGAIAWIYMALGDIDCALAWAEREENRFIKVPVEPLLDSLRSHPHAERALGALVDRREWE